MFKKYWFMGILALGWLSPSAQAENLAGVRAQFQQMYADLQAGKTEEFSTLSPELRQYALYPWLEYEYLRQKFDEIPDAQIVNFAMRYPGSLMADALYERLAQRLAGKGDWQKLLTQIPSSLDDGAAQCYRTQALAAVGQTDRALEQGKQIWDELSNLVPGSCLPVVDLLRAHQRLTAADYWTQISKAMESNQVTLALQLADGLEDEAQREQVKLWANVRKNPDQYLPTALEQPDLPEAREIIVFGLERLAKNDTEQAEKLWSTARQKLKFTPAESGRVESVLGMYQAVRHEPAALRRLAAIPTEYRTQDGNLWLLRMAARLGDWNKVVDAAGALKFDNERDAALGRYWQARGLEQTGHARAANSLYAEIARMATFYGFLAADQLGQDYQGLREKPVDRGLRVQGLHKVAAIQRAFEWFALGEREQGRKEWFRALRQMDAQGMLAAAELATRSGDPNLAIWTVSRAKEWDEVNLRFPLAHTNLVMEQARAQGIQPAWILGVMRRESAFDTGAESSAKALGLMQLILPTAQHVGRKLGLQLGGRDDILQPVTNVQLGSAYLREMLGRFSGNYAQATAAYNAGPGRPLKWAPPQPINADQWIESIPFNETRDYVQAVMAYTTIYDYKLNKDQSRRLSERLSPVIPDAKSSSAQP